jgi:integrase/recombinase XerD
MQVKFTLRGAAIQVTATWAGHRLRKSTGEKINPKNWNARTERVKASEADYLDINESLDDLERDIKEAMREGISLDELEKKVFHKQAVKPAVNKYDLNYAWNEWKLHNQAQLSREYIKKFKTVITHLNTFQPDLSLDAINPKWLNRYLEWCMKEEKDSKGKVTKTALSNGSLTNHTKLLRLLLKEAGLKNDFLNTGMDTTGQRIFLTWPEVEQLISYAPQTQRLQDTKDVFLFGVFTGLRYSDVQNLKSSDVQAQGDYTVIRITQIKTREQLTIALNDYALEIIDKHKGRYTNCLPVVSNQKLNAALKDLCKAAGINSPVTRIRYYGSLRKEQRMEKWQLVSTHTARHTFATLSLERGMDVTLLSKTLGHSDLSTTMIYAKIVDERKHQAMRDVWNKK